ncbi:MAG: 2'-5' RNA ligase family protein [Chloroflexi bacterium]|nr:2'-5' RNA ligase family protein [Chloroflexota bacterium]
MKATFALLADWQTHNFVRKLAWDVHCAYGIGLDVTRLPPHVSLKQPFAANDLTSLEEYMMELAPSIQPFEIHLPRLQIVKVAIEGLETGILWLDVQETSLLRDLHNRLNNELAKRFTNTQAAFDGGDYHFHMTVSIGSQPWDVYQRMFKDIVATPIDLRFTPQELVLFVNDDNANLNGGYMTHKILPLH